MGKLWRYAVAGNIKKTRIDEDGILRYGTKVFKGNTKIYIFGRWVEDSLIENKTEIPVLGLSRGGRYLVDRVPLDCIENFRITRVYTPQVLDIMANWEFNSRWWGNTQAERDDASAFLKRVKETCGIG
jgi:hypothetical protein